MSIESLSTLLQHSERQRDAGLAAMLQAEDAVRRLQEQAQQLQIYRQETQQRHPAQSGRSTSIELLRYHQGFVQRLEQAIEQQQAQLQSAHSRAAQLRTELLALETRVASVRKLMERRQDQARQQQARQEQRRTDDAASRPRAEGGLNGGWRHSTQSAPL